MAVRGPEIIIMLLLSLGGGGDFPNDLVSLIDAGDYFPPRGVELKADNLVQVASKAPTDAKEGLAQLLAIRWLGENQDQLGGSKEAVRKTLQPLAEGPEGFARDYARTALGRIDGKSPVGLRSMPKDSVRTQALEWFPEEVEMAGAFDLRPPAGQTSSPEQDQFRAKQFKQIQSYVNQLIPNQAKDEVYIFAETVGNVRIDRASFGYAPDPQAQHAARLFFRLTGLVHHKRLVDYVRQSVPGVTIDEKKGPKGEPITQARFEHGPGLALVGDTDLIVTTFEGKNDNPQTLIDQVLEVRAGRKSSVLKSAWAKELQEVPVNAVALLAGLLPAELRGELPKSPLGVAPQQISLAVTAAKEAGKGVDVHFRALMDNEADAKRFPDSWKEVLKVGNEELKNVPQDAPVVLLKALLDLVQNAELKADGTKVLGELRVTADTQKTLWDAAEELVKKLGG
jgi:hypothetical protein